MPRNDCVIDRHPEREKIIGLLLSGGSGNLKAAAKLAGISRQACNLYRLRHLKPAVADAAQIAALKDLTAQVAAGANGGAVTKTDLAELTRHVAAIESNPLAAAWHARERFLWGKSQKLVEDSEQSQKVYFDKDGQPVFNGTDVSARSSAMGAALRNLELAGRAAGVLVEAGGAGGINVERMLVVLPRADRMPAAPVIEAEISKPETQ